MLLLGNHGLNEPQKNSSQITNLLKSFGNLATFMRHFEVFSTMFQKKTGKKINIKMYPAVANVPLGNFNIVRNQSSGGYTIKNPSENNDHLWIAPKMLDFYGNWNELQNLSTLTRENIINMDTEELTKREFQNLSEEQISLKIETARKTQQTFLHILRIFAPSMVNMQHPNISVKIEISNNK